MTVLKYGRNFESRVESSYAQLKNDVRRKYEDLCDVRRKDISPPQGKEEGARRGQGSAPAKCARGGAIAVDEPRREAR